MFITISMVSAENVTDTSSLSIEDETNDNVASMELTKKTTNYTKSVSNDKKASKISIDSQSAKYDTTTVFTSIVTDGNGDDITEGTVVYKINGKSIGNVEVNNGVASLTHKLTDMTPKTYMLTAKYAENSDYYESSDDAVLTILKHDSKITVNDASVITRNKVTLKASVIDSETEKKATSGKVAFKINGKTVGHANVYNGVASYVYTASKLTAKKYAITATFGGNNLLNSDVSKKSTLTVKAIPTKMTVNKITGYSNSVVLKATVVDKSSYNYLPLGVVVFKINGKTIGNSTISNGKASFKYNTTKLTRGIYEITALLKPTSTYAHSSATNDLVIRVENNFTFNQIKTAAVNVRTQFEANNSVSTVYIGKSRMVLSEFLALMIKAVENIKNGNGNKKVPYAYYNNLNTQTDALKTGVLNISQILEIGDRTLSFMKSNGRPPKYVSTVFGKMGFYNIVYTYTRVMDVSTTDFLVSTCRVYHWNTIHPTNSKLRKIYLTSDVIYNKNTDIAFMNKIKSKLKSLGYTVVIGGYGPNSHCEEIWYKTFPHNAVQLSIFGGADAGVIYDVCTRSFMRYKENRLLFFVYYSATSTDITGKDFLKRAHDDNYSVSSFKGLAHPDIYLKSHGYDYVYTTNVDTIVNALLDYIT